MSTPFPESQVKNLALTVLFVPQRFFFVTLSKDLEWPLRLLKGINYRGTWLMKNSPPPQYHHRTLGIVLL